jgi:endonuclease/exonuclease/phosphatase family metal-dependent hydrolase
VLRLAVVAVVVLAIVGLDRSVAARTSPEQETYLQFNMCGNVCNSGGLAVIAKLETVIARQQPSAVTLNEVCENQFTRLVADLGRYSGRFDATGPICRDGARYGNAALLRSSDASLVGSWALPDLAGSEPRRLLCITGHPNAGRPLVACVTHISTQRRDAGAQIEAVADTLHELTGTHGVVLLGGDFNSDPSDAWMSPLYPTCRMTAALREADSAGCASRSVRNRLVGVDLINQETFSQHKYDYIFLSTAGWSSMTAHVTDTLDGLSDHKALWATATDAPEPPSPQA